MGNVSSTLRAYSVRPQGLPDVTATRERVPVRTLALVQNPLKKADRAELQLPRSGHIPAAFKLFSSLPARPGQTASSLDNLPELSFFAPRVRADFVSSVNRAGLSPETTRKLALALQATGQPQALNSLVQVLKSSRPDPIRSFSEQFLQLSGIEQSVALAISQLLLLSPAPADLRQQLKNQLNKLPSAPDGRKGMDLGRTLNRLGLYLPSLQPQAPGTEDASGRLRQVLMGKYDTPDQQGYIRDMIATARKEGFQLTLQIESAQDIPALRQQIFADLGPLQPPLRSLTDLDQVVKFVASNPGGSTWAEDNKWLTGDGTVVTLPDADQALARLSHFTQADTGAQPGEIGSEGHHTAGRAEFDPEDLVPHYATQGAVSGNAESPAYRTGVVNDANRDEYLNAQALAKAQGSPLRTTRFYNEGGNMLVGSLPNGEPYAVIGRDGLIVSTFQLEALFAAHPEQVPEFAPTREQAALAGLGLNQPFETLSAGQRSLVDQTWQRLQASGEAYQNPAANRQRALQFLARLELSKDVFAKDLALPKQQLIFVAQPEFHIDMHLRPLAPGQILINDFEANDKLLAAALSKAPADSWEAHELESMRERNGRIQSVMEPVMRQIESQLKAGGLEVVRAPGVMQGLMHHPDPSLPPEDQVRRVNFMNAIPATRPGSHQQIYLTNYTSLAPLREAYADYLRQEHGIDTLYWIGIGGGEQTKSPSELSLDLEGGLDCRENH